MKTRVAAATAMLSLAVSASAQITKNQKYDWGWSYKLEMPETGLKCEFPEKPVVRTLAYGYMTAATYKNEIYIAAKLENPDAYDIACRTEEFATELEKVYGLPITDLAWDKVQLENGNLTISGDAKGNWAQFHIDAIATDDVLTIFVYSHRDELTVPGHFFATSYSVYDIPEGNIAYLPTVKRAKKAQVLEHTNGRSLVRLENSPVTVEWPDVPTLSVDRNEAAYCLSTDNANYTTRVVEVGPQVSYAFFNTFIGKEHQKVSRNGAKLNSDQTDVAFTIGHGEEAFFRKLTYTTNSGMLTRFYVGADNKIFVQELTTKSMEVAAKRYLNTFENSVRNEYDTRSFVTK
jgi:hypothetical protein